MLSLPPCGEAVFLTRAKNDTCEQNRSLRVLYGLELPAFLLSVTGFSLLIFLLSLFLRGYFFPFFPFSRNSSVSGSEKPSVFLPKARTEMSLMFVFVWVDRNKFSAGETKLLSWPSL